MPLNFPPLHPSRFTEAKHLLLKHLPPFTAVPDVKAALEKRNVPGVTDVSPLYERFRPMDTALVAMASPNHLNEAMVLLRQFNIIGIDVHAERFIPPTEWETLAKRGRGHQGRKQAVARGILDGTGPWAGLGGSTNAQKSLVLSGFPGTTSTDMVEKFLVGLEVAKSKEESMVYKLPLPPNVNTLYSKFLVIMKTEKDAWTAWRELNQTVLPTNGRRQNIVQAQLIF